MRKSIYFNFILCLTLINCGDKDKERQKESEIDGYVLNTTGNSNGSIFSRTAVKIHDKIINTDGPYRMTVKMRDSKNDHKPLHNIVIYHDSKNKESVDPVYAFYTAINCQSALWVVRKINNFVDQYMMSDQATFNRELWNFANSTRTNVDRFISILTFFLGKIPNSSFYMDKGVLKQLTSFRIKINLMMSRSSGTDDSYGTQFDTRNIEMVQLLLVEIVGLQRFMSVHCEFAPLITTTIPDNFKIWVFVDGSTDDTGIEAFLSITINNGLESDSSLDNCLPTYLLLEKITKIRGKDVISSMISEVTLDKGRSNGDTISIGQIVNQMLISFDIDVIMWYSDSILTAIMKLLCHMIITKENVLNDEALIKVYVINSKIESNNDILPAYFIDGFSKLKCVIISELKLYCDSLRGFHITFSIDETKLTEYVYDLLNRIDEHFLQITCAQKYLKYLRKENDKYYTPGSHNQNTLLANNSMSDELAYSIYHEKPTACGFVLNLYLYSSRQNDDKSNVNNEKRMSVLKTISNFCVLLIKNEKNNWDLIKTAYDIATLLKNQQFEAISNNNKLLLYERILGIVMAELNLYRIKYCRTETHCYLFINDSVIKSYGVDSLLNFMQRFFRHRYSLTISNNVSELENLIEFINDVQYFKIDYLYDTFVKNSDIVQLYKGVVQVYWNRQLQSIDTIFTDLMKTTFNPQNMYALYDIYNKFFLAVIFHEAKRVFNSCGFDYTSTNAELVKLKNEFDYNRFEDVFPDDLTTFKTYLSTIFKFMYTQDNYDSNTTTHAVDEVRKATSDATVELQKFNIVIHNSVKLPSRSSRRSTNNVSFLTLLHNDVDTLVRNFNHEFQKLKRFIV